MVKIALIILDGIADRPYRELGGKTPLEAASTPALDAFATRGTNGLYHAVSPGVACPSELAHWRIFGYRSEEFPGRGAIEAMGFSVPFEPQEVCLLANLSAAREKNGALWVIEPRVPLPEAAWAEAFSRISSFEAKKLRLKLHRTRGPDAILVLEAPASPLVTDADTCRSNQPVATITPRSEAEGDTNARQTADFLNDYLRWAYRTLGDLPAREPGKKLALICQRAGQRRNLPSFAHRFGMRGATVSSGAIYKGIAETLGWTAAPAPSLEDPGQELRERLELAERLFEDHDFVHIHTKAADEAAHTGEPRHKAKTIESLDRGCKETLARWAELEDRVTVVTADHATPSQGPLIHSGEEVPLAITGLRVPQDSVRLFGEGPAASGRLGHLRGGDLMPLLLNFADRCEVLGLRSTPDPLPYFPGSIEPLRLK